MLKLKIILGSTRPTRFSEKVAPWVQEMVTKNGTFDAELLDLRDYPMPFYDQAMTPSSFKKGEYAHEIVRQWARKIGEADAFLVIAPEYNHGYSAVLKNAFDSIYPEWHQKPIGFVSYGSVGGGRSVEQMRMVAIELQMAPVRQAVHIFEPWKLLDEKGALRSGSLDPYQHALENTLTQLSWWAQALKTAREQTTV